MYTESDPGAHFAYQLRYVIRKARLQRIFPAESRPRTPANLDPAHPAQPANRHVVGPSTSASQGSSQSPLDFDVFMADQLLQQPFDLDQLLTDPEYMAAHDHSVGQATLPVFGEVSAQQGTSLWFDLPSLGEPGDAGLPDTAERPDFTDGA